MASPYTTQTISGYNSSPPADDGSNVSTNEIKWSTHKTKLGDPVKTLAEAINTELLSAFGLVFGQEISTHSSNYTVLAADQGKFLSVTGTTTITLLAAATAGANFAIAIINNGTATVTIDGNASETINGNLTVDLSPGESAILTCNGTLWVGPIIGRDSAKGSDIASATTTDIGAATGNFVDITGTTTITGLGTVKAGTKRTVQFDGSLTLTYNATSLILPGNADIVTQAGDVAEFVSLGSGNWICTNYQPDLGYTGGSTEITGAAASSITVSGLDGNYTGGYIVDGYIINTSGVHSIFLDINGDTTAANYYRNVANLSVAYGQVDSATNTFVTTSSTTAYPIHMHIIQNTYSGEVYSLIRVFETGTANQTVACVQYTVTDNITSIGLRSASSNIDIGSFLKVRKIY